MSENDVALQKHRKELSYVKKERYRDNDTFKCC